MQTSMGLSRSCPFAMCMDLETYFTSTNCLEDDDDGKFLVRSVTFKNQTFIPSATKYVDSQRMSVQESFILKIPSPEETRSIYIEKADISLAGFPFFDHSKG